MATPGNAKLALWAGNDFDLRLRLEDVGAGINLTGTVIVMTMTWPGGSLTLRSDGTSPSITLSDQTVANTRGWFNIHMSPETTRLFPTNTPVSYEIEHRSGGKERTWLAGDITVSTRNNIDG